MGTFIELLNLIGALLGFVGFGLAFAAAVMAEVDPLVAALRALASAGTLLIVFNVLRRLLIPLFIVDTAMQREGHADERAAEEIVKTA
jgi:hypothetical protein